MFVSWYYIGTRRVRDNGRCLLGFLPKRGGWYGRDISYVEALTPSGGHYLMDFHDGSFLCSIYTSGSYDVIRVYLSLQRNGLLNVFYSVITTQWLFNRDWVQYLCTNTLKSLLMLVYDLCNSCLCQYRLVDVFSLIIPSWDQIGRRYLWLFFTSYESTYFRGNVWCL